MKLDNQEIESMEKCLCADNINSLCILKALAILFLPDHSTHHFSDLFPPTLRISQITTWSPLNISMLQSCCPFGSSDFHKLDCWDVHCYTFFRLVVIILPTQRTRTVHLTDFAVCLCSEGFVSKNLKALSLLVLTKYASRKPHENVAERAGGFTSELQLVCILAYRLRLTEEPVIAMLALTAQNVELMISKNALCLSVTSEGGIDLTALNGYQKQINANNFQAPLGSEASSGHTQNQA